MTHISKASLLVVTLVALVGCSQNSSSPSGGGGGGPVANDIKDQTEGTFLTMKSAPLENGQVPADMQFPESPECASLPSDQKDDYGWDPRVIVGDVFSGKSSMAGPENAFTISWSTTVTEKTASKLVTNAVWSNIQVNPSPGPIPSSITVINTCVKGAEADAYPDCDMQFQGMPPSTGGGSNETLSCSYSYESVAESGLAESGTYTMRSGQSVNALRVTSTHPITITCKRGDNGPEEDYGKGLAQNVSIKTLDLVDSYPMSCYSDRSVYMYSAYAQEGGRILNVIKEEVFSGPIR